MENSDYLLQVKYSISKVTEDGKKKIYSKKRKKPLNKIDPVEIIDEINNLDERFGLEDYHFSNHSRNGFFSSVNDFINKWKYAYNEMLRL